MKKVREEDILVNPDQIPQGREVDTETASIIVSNIKKKQKEILGKKPLKYPFANQ